MFDLNHISELLQAILLAILPVLAAAGARWLVGEAKVQKAKLSAQQIEFVQKAARTAVLAAEQFGLVAKAKKEYADKKQIAIQIVSDRLEKAGIYMDEAHIADEIEAAVMEEFNRFEWTKLEPPAPASL